LVLVDIYSVSSQNYRHFFTVIQDNPLSTEDTTKGTVIISLTIQLLA